MREQLGSYRSIQLSPHPQSSHPQLSSHPQSSHPHFSSPNTSVPVPILSSQAKEPLASHGLSFTSSPQIHHGISARPTATAPRGIASNFFTPAGAQQDSWCTARQLVHSKTAGVHQDSSMRGSGSNHARSVPGGLGARSIGQCIIAYIYRAGWESMHWGQCIIS